MSCEQIHFVTGRLAEHALRKTLAEMARHAEFGFTVDVLPISVAALMTPDWVARHISATADASRIILPGYCHGDLTPVAKATGKQVERGPRDLRQLPDFLGRVDPRDEEYGDYDIEIVAEINHAPRLTLRDTLAEARRLADAGADMIDVGCDPGDAWSGVSTCVQALRDQGHRVSIDSLNPAEIEPAVRAGAELVLSVNGSNREAALDWGCEVVVIPDQLDTLSGLLESVELLAAQNVPLRIDPVLEPIGCGFAASLGRYLEVRRQFPQAEMLMGVGNLSELTDADSAAINVLLLGICQELGIRSVLTTEVINWARSSVRECDLARRLVYYAVQRRVPPKNVEPKLVVLRDPKLREYDPAELVQMSQQIRDHNYRLFAQADRLHLLAAGLHLTSEDPFQLFEQLLETEPKNLDPAHAFYLGFELAKAATALNLGKQYEQDESLDWGFLTVAEDHHRLSRSKTRKKTL